ncbi:MAG: hypothetical protein E7625_06460 [Ruminococcaceae bacterium]|nr:hypothetical protein [Oscillospiraceae bacterium]
MLSFSKRSLTALALLLAMLMLLVSCGNKLHVITASGDTYFDKKTDTYYSVLPPAYEPIARGEEYGTVDLAGMTQTLYEVVGQSPTKYLCSSFGDVYYDRDASPVLFDAWKLSAAYVCTNTATVISELTLHADKEEHAPVLDDLQAAIVSGANVTYPSYLTPKRIYVLRFTSQNAPGLYYSIKLLQYGEDIYDVVKNEAGEDAEVSLGNTFLYDRYTDRFVAIDDTVFRLLDNEELAPTPEGETDQP